MIHGLTILPTLKLISLQFANENCENRPASNTNIDKVNSHLVFFVHSFVRLFAGSLVRSFGRCLIVNWSSRMTENLAFIYYRRRSRCDSETTKRTELIAVTMSSYFPRIAFDTHTQPTQNKIYWDFRFLARNYLALVDTRRKRERGR